MLTKTIGQLSTATSILNTDLIEIEQSGISKSSTMQLLRSQIAVPLLSATATTTLTTVTISSTVGVINVVIPVKYMIADAGTGVSAIVTVTTGTGATAIIPLYPEGTTITPRIFIGTIYVDDSGNCGFTETIPTVCAEMWLNSTTTASTIVPIQYNSIYKDTHGGCTTGAAAKYTCKVSGRYLIKFMASSTAAASQYYIYKGGILFALCGYCLNTFPATCSREIDLIAGEYIDIRPTGSISMTGAAAYADCFNWVQITRVGI
jgi:hypothetical protein